MDAAVAPAAAATVRVGDPLAAVVADLVHCGRAGEALAVLSTVSDASRRIAHLADALTFAIRFKLYAAVAELLAGGFGYAEPAVTAPLAAGLADDTDALHSVLTRLSSQHLRDVFCGCVLTGQEALALQLLPHLLSLGVTLQTSQRSAATTPLALAAECGRLSLLAAMLKRQADTEAEDADGRTALARACAAGQAEAARMLLESGADPGRADREGRTCGQLLAQVDGGGVSEIAELLAAAQCLGSSRTEREQSAQLHSLLFRCGFTARRAELHCEAADFLLHRVAEPLTAGRTCRLGGSFAEGWGACLVQMNGRVAADSDVNWILGGEGAADTVQLTGSREAHAGTVVTADWEAESRAPNPHEMARVAQLLRGCADSPVLRTGDLPACFADQERRVMRNLSTVQGQLFVIVKVVFKRLLPSMGAAGLTSYHAKTVLFFMLARHSRRRGWWQPGNLLPLVRKALDLALELLDLDERPCVCMPHFFAADCHLAFRDPDEDSKRRVREALSELRMEPARIDGFLRNSLLPMRPLRPPGLPLYFHPYTLLPPDIGVPAPEVTEQRPGSEYADAYLLVLRCLTDLGSRTDTEADKAACMASLAALPLWCQCARQCMTAMVHLRFGDRQRAVELLTACAKQRVQRFWDMGRCFFFGGRLGSGADTVSKCGDWAWRFCYSSKTRVEFKKLPLFTMALLQPKSDSPHRLYVNFRCLLWSLLAELLPRHMVEPADWYSEMKFDPDYQEVLTLANYSNSPLHLNFCSAALDDLRARSRHDLTSETQTIRNKLNRLTMSSGNCQVVARPAKKVV